MTSRSELHRQIDALIEFSAGGDVAFERALKELHDHVNDSYFATLEAEVACTLIVSAACAMLVGSLVQGGINRATYQLITDFAIEQLTVPPTVSFPPTN